MQSLSTTLKALAVKAHWISASQFGLDPRRLLLSLRGMAAYGSDWRRFRKGYAGEMAFTPCLHDRYEEGGTTKSEYFWQDLLVARWIFESKPARHVDVGSRVDGFVAHVASFREIEVIDVRPITTQIPGIVFRQADLMRADSLPFEEGTCDSLSCLHALEHFGLGRYGDPIDPKGHERGLSNLARLVAPGGTLYLSTPIGRERVEFNANRIFDPRRLVAFAESCGLQLRRLSVVESGGIARVVDTGAETLHGLARAPYALGIFVFAKLAKEVAG